MADYTNAFRKLQAHLGADVPFAGITADQIRSFLGELSTPRAPNGVAKRPVKGLSNKTILNIYRAVGALDMGDRRRDHDSAPLRGSFVRPRAKAGVQDCHLHRFHLTFAVNFLSYREAARRNGGNALELQWRWGIRRRRWCRRT